MKISAGASYFLLVLVAMALVAGIFSIPVLKQNRINALMRAQTALRQSEVTLRGELLTLEMEWNRQTKRDRLEKLAQEKLGLVYGAVPVKLVEVRAGSAQ